MSQLVSVNLEQSVFILWPFNLSVIIPDKRSELNMFPIIFHNWHQNLHWSPPFWNPFTYLHCFGKPVSYYSNCSIHEAISLHPWQYWTIYHEHLFFNMDKKSPCSHWLKFVAKDAWIISQSSHGQKKSMFSLAEICRKRCLDYFLATAMTSSGWRQQPVWF